MKRYRYDGTFTGLLTVLAKTESGWNGIESISCSVSSEAVLFAGGEEHIDADEHVAAGFYARICRRISAEAQRSVYHAFLSEVEGVESILLQYLELGMKKGSGVEDLLCDSRVAQVHRLARRVRHEAHRMKGFIRFMEVAGGFFYAPIEPDFNILPLIASHFAERFGDQHWVIHDVRRNRAIIHDRGRKQWVLTSMELAARVEPTVLEQRCQCLWRQYFTAGSIEGRKNLKLQRSKVPMKYRKHLVEFVPEEGAGGQSGAG